MNKNLFDKTKTNNQNINEYNNDICTFIVANDIPIWKLQNQNLNVFLKIY